MILRQSVYILLLLTLLITFWSCSQTEQHPVINTAIIPEASEGRAYERFQMLNKRVQENRGEIDLLFVGDSITEQWEQKGTKIWEEYYGDLKALNIGINADRTQHILWRAENGNMDGIRPKVTILMIGTNNIAKTRNTASETLEGIRVVVKYIMEKLPDTKILLLGIFPRGQSFSENRGDITQVNQALKKTYSNTSLYYQDIGHHFINHDGTIPEEVMPDELHLSEKGYRIWAEAMEPILTEMLPVHSGRDVNN